MVAAAVVVAAILAACGSSGPGAAHGSQRPGSSLEIASASGAGSVVVDGRGRTVYVLLDARHRDVACTAATGCTAVWPPVRVSGGATPAAGSGVQASLVGASGGQATYHGWRLYEYSGDTTSGEASGAGLASDGGTWYALRSNGAPVAPSSSSGGW